MLEMFYGKHGKHVTLEDVLGALACAGSILLPFVVFALTLKGA